jgi:hypothetical protein
MEWAIPTGKPVPGGVGRQLHVPPLVRHARDDQAEAGPRIEPLVNQVQLKRTVADSTAARAARRRRPRAPSSSGRLTR